MFWIVRIWRNGVLRHRGAARRALSRWSKRLAVLALCLAAMSVTVVYAAQYWLGPPPLEAASESSKLVLDRKGRLLRPFATRDGRWRLPVAAAEVDERYLAMLLAYEDKRFYQHGGIDLRAVLRSAWQFVSQGRAVSGASTLTMQLARLLEARPTRSAGTKFIQIIRALQLERRLSKREILELYLKLAPFGGNIEGVRAASLTYFGKEPRRLNLAEAALLVALPQSPQTRRPDRFPAAARRARGRVIGRAVRAGILTQAEAQWARAAPLPSERRDFPVLAAHLAGRVIAEKPEAEIIRLTIDRDLQEAVEALASRQASRLGPRLSIAVMVIEHATGEVLAQAGSPGYFDEARHGAIDMTQAVRSPGSALKPFIYGLGFEAGLAHPSTLIEDRPVRYAGYAPENFDGSFRGSVTVREALQLSLNVPALKMLAALGPARLSARFRQAGLTIAMPRNLTVALGGVGLRLQDLALLYAALARGGEPVALRHVMPERRETSTAGNSAPLLLSPLAAWYVTQILKEAPPPPHASGGGIAFKTGTSYGYRDAWAAGFDGRHTVAVWAGRPDGTATPGLMGLTAAAPLVFDIFAKIGPERAPFKPAPASAIFAATAALPPPLQYFREPDQPLPEAGGAADLPLRIAFPPDKAEIELGQEPDGSATPVAVKAEGGALPLTWLINGAPAAAAAHRREMAWTPEGKGFIQLLVIDAKGRVDRVSVRLR